MNRDTLKSLILEYLKGHPQTQFTEIYNGVGNIAIERELIEGPSGYRPGAGYYEGLLGPQEQLLASELIWELIIQGILTPGMNAANPELPRLRLTAYGERCVNENTILPHDYGTYLESIKSMSVPTDSVFLVYITESVEAFNKGLYNSSVLSLGIASEQLTVMLIEGYRSAIKTEENKEKFNQALARARHIAYQFEEVYKRLESVKGQMPNDIGHDISMLKFLEEMIRRNRNDAGHPSGRVFSRDEAQAALIVFPQHYKTTVKILDWLSNAEI